MSTAILDRDLSSAWLDAALQVARQQLPIAQMRDQLCRTLMDTPLGKEALKKTLTALTRVWLQPAERRAGHTLWALEYADRTSDWRPLHLGAMLADEPFIHRLLDACGREQRAIGEIDTVALRFRMRNAYGPKSSIDRATQRGVQTLRSLGVLEGPAQASISRPGCLVITDPELAAWLVRCLLMGRQAESVAIEDLGYVSEFFGLRMPAALPRSAAGVSKHIEGLGRTVLAVDR